MKWRIEPRKALNSWDIEADDVFVTGRVVTFINRQEPGDDNGWEGYEIVAVVRDFVVIRKIEE